MAATSCSTIRSLSNPKNKTYQIQDYSHSPPFNKNIGPAPSIINKGVHKDIYRSYKAEMRAVSNHNLFFSDRIENTNWLQFKYAVLMDVPVESLYNLPLLNYMEDWYGTPYRYGGSAKDGIDCSAFTAGLMAAIFGITIPRTVREQFYTSPRVARNELREGDLLFFNTTGAISHVGVYVANNKFIHASVTNGVIISDLNDNYYSRRYMGAGRVNDAK